MRTRIIAAAAVVTLAALFAFVPPGCEAAKVARGELPVTDAQIDAAANKAAAQAIAAVVKSGAPAPTSADVDRWKSEAVASIRAELAKADAQVDAAQSAGDAVARVAPFPWNLIGAGLLGALGTAYWQKRGVPAAPPPPKS